MIDSHTATPPYTSGDDMSFDSYCIVCDRIIVPPKEPESEAVKMVKKKSAAGTIRVKNPDGTTTTRTASGQKVTRPNLKRDPTSMNRLATVAATNNAVTKTHNANQSKSKGPPEAPFCSSIYCSRDCASVDASKSSVAYKNIARTLSNDFHYDSEQIITTAGEHQVPNAPPSPLFVSGSDTESSNGAVEAAGPACSAPKMMEYFLMSRAGPDDAWHENQRQRRSSMHPAVRPTSMSRQPSVQSQRESSNDSLLSLWNDPELYLSRSISGSSKVRGMTPVHPDRDAMGHGNSRQSISSNESIRSAPIPTRPLPRSNLSQTSLAASPAAQAIPIPPEFGSAPNHTLSLLHSYANAFPIRDASGTSASYTQKGFAFPGSIAASPAVSRRGSATLSRDTSGTIRAKSRTSPEVTTWDSFGRDALAARKTSAIAVPDRGRDELAQDCTPKQSLEVENGRWKIKYTAPATVRQRTSRSNTDTTYSTSEATHFGDAAVSGSSRLSISSSSSTSNHSRTPQTGHMPPPDEIPRRSSSVLPDLAGLRVGNCTPCTYLSSSPGASVPKSGFNWDKLEQSGGKTYALPQGLKIDRSKAGLFYFQ